MRVFRRFFTEREIEEARRYRALIESVTPVSRRKMRSFGWYLFPRSWEVNLKLYKAMGVPLWKQVVMSTGGRIRGRELPEFRLTGLRGRRDSDEGYNYFLIPTVEGSIYFLRETYINEGAHLGFLLFSLLPLPFAAQFIFTPWGALFWIFLSQVLMNFYLVLLQRYNRVRVLRFLILLRKREERLQRNG